MRIIAGKLKGRQFAQPHGHKTHPMAEKVRGALFNVLGDVEGLDVLDAFAGSGALSFEAASHGTRSVIAIDNDKSAYLMLSRNIAELGLDNVAATRANVSGWSDNNKEQQFNILLLDPPYDNLQLSLLTKLASRHLKPNGLAVLSWPGKAESPDFDGLDKRLQKSYGDAQLVFYRKVS